MNWFDGLEQERDLELEKGTPAGGDMTARARAHTHTTTQEDEPDPRRMQVNLTGFLERNTGAFMGDLWNLCISAQENFRIEKGAYVYASAICGQKQIVP